MVSAAAKNNKVCWSSYSQCKCLWVCGSMPPIPAADSEQTKALNMG